jgi:uncharacterized protein YjbJ (UPF0337 family)
MNTLEIKGDWNITKGKLKQKWAKLTDNDLRYTEGQQEELVGRLQSSPAKPVKWSKTQSRNTPALAVASKPSKSISEMD